jgi:GT2 family glycosyltransferase
MHFFERLSMAISKSGGLTGVALAIRRLVRRDGLAGLMRGLRRARIIFMYGNRYIEWIRRYDTLTDKDIAKIRARNATMQHNPLISILMPTYNTPENLLRDAIESVCGQIYENWELCIADDGSTMPAVRKCLEEYAACDPRIKVIYRADNGHISRSSNSALELATGEWIALLDHDDQLVPHALFCVADAINKQPDAMLIYSDEDKKDFNGQRYEPYFKCDWNPMLFLSHNLITHLGVYKASLVRELGGFRIGYEGAQDYDLAIRFIEKVQAYQIYHIPHILYHWRVMHGSTAFGPQEKPYAMLAGERALNDHFVRTGTKAKAHLIGFGFRIDYELPDPPPVVSIIIPTRNAWQLTKQCIDSIRRLTTYPSYEIILVDNGSNDEEALGYFAQLERENTVRILRDNQPFNYAALNNGAVKIAQGTVLVLLNNDTEIISPDWLTRMVSLALQPGVGGVGAKLLFPNNTIQHGGVVMGLGGLAGHAHLNFPRSSAGYVGRAALTQNFSAVTGACLVVRKELYERVGGLNEQDLAIAYNDVDFCLKLTRLGLRNVWTPFAELYHHESATRGYETTPEKMKRFQSEKSYMLQKWRSEIDMDPAYSQNLTLDAADFTLAFPPRCVKPWHNGQERTASGAQKLASGAS